MTRGLGLVGSHSLSRGVVFIDESPGKVLFVELVGG
jgi:hypothetical protein